MWRFLSLAAPTALLICTIVCAQTPAAVSAKPTAQMIGEVTAIDPSLKKITVKQDKTGTEYSVSLETAKTFLKVLPGAKDLKSAVRYEPNELNVGDRVLVRGFNVEGGANAINAASVVLMTARDLEKKHEAESAAWKESTAGTVISVDGATQQLKANVRTPFGPHPVEIEAKNAQFTRYSPDSPNAPVASQITDIQPGDQVRVIGDKNADGSVVTAQKIYSGAFRTIAGKIVSISQDGKQLTVSDLQTKQPVEVSLTGESNLHKLPPEVAAMLAMRLNRRGGVGMRGPGAGPPGSDSGSAGSYYSTHGGPPDQTGGAQMQGSPRRPTADISQILERLPKIDVSALKPGDAVIVAGGVGHEASQLIATNVIAGVEPILQSAPPRAGGRNNNSGIDDWNLDLSVPSE